MFSPDWKENAENGKDFVSDGSFFKCRSVEEICGFLDAKPLKSIEFDIFFKNALGKYDRNSILDLLQHANVEYTNNISEIFNNLNILFSVLNTPFILKMTESIGTILNNTITSSILNEIRSLKASQNTILEDMKNIQNTKLEEMKKVQQINYEDMKKEQNAKLDEIKKTQQLNYEDMKKEQNAKLEEMKNTQNAKFDEIKRAHQNSLDDVKYKIENVSKNVKLQIRQENFNKMKMLEKTSSNFDKIYDIFEKIADEDDYISMKLAVESKYHEVTAQKVDRCGSNNLTQNCITHGADMNNFKLVKMLVEFGVNPSINAPCGANAMWLFCRRGNLEALKYFCELPGINVNAPSSDNRSILYIASLNDNYGICKYLLSKDGTDVNMRTNDGETALSVAKSYSVRSLLKSHGAK